MDSNLLMIFIKNPVEGDVKTRLGASIGSTNALLIYKKLLDHTRTTALSVECKRQVWYSSMIDRRDEWEGTSFDKKLQKGETLGARMACAFREAFESGHKRVVIIGSDCHDLDPHHLRQAFRDLESYDAVIGPSEDGGYYLLGLNRPDDRLFKDIEWSSAEVYDQTVSRFSDLGMSYSILETLNDIDTIEDLKKSDLSLP